MTTNEPTEDPESEKNRRPLPADEQIEDDVDVEKTSDLAELPEGHEETQLHTQRVKDRTEAEPAEDEQTFHFAAPSPAENVGKDEADTGTLPVDEEVTNVEDEAVENTGDVQNSEPGAPNEIDNLESDDRRAAQILIDPAEQQDTPSAPARSKEAVQDPGGVDITPTAANDGVIDVDTFDDAVSDDDDPDPSPAADETMVELENTNEPSNDEAQEAVMNHDARSEPIDLTASPAKQTKESPTLPESDEKMGTEEITATEKHDAIRREGVIDVDEPEGQEDENVPIEVASTRFLAEDIKSPPAEEDEKHVTGTTDTETVSADLNADVNGEDASSGEVPVESTALETVEGGEVESRLSLDRAGVGDRDEEEERSARESRMGSEDDGLEPQGHEGTAIQDGGIDFMEASARKPDSEHGERPVAQDESEDDEMEDDVASGRNEQVHEENEAEEDGSPSAPNLIAASENEAREKTASTDQNKSLAEDIQDKDFRRHEADKHVVKDLQDKEATSRPIHTDGKTVRPSNGDVSAPDATNEDDVATVTSDGEPQPVENMEGVEQDASAIEVAALKETTMVDAETGDIDVSHTARAGVTPDPVSLEPSNSKEIQSSSPGSDLLLSREDNKGGSEGHVIVESAEREIEAIRSGHSVAPSMTEADTQASKQQDQGPSGAEKETGRGAEAVPVHHKSTSGASEAMKQLPVPTEKSPVEESKSTGTGHLAPMFGIQLSRPIKSGPVTFSSPPSFPRYSLNPQAAPFIPAKLRKDESSEQPTDASETPSAAVSTPSKETKVTDGKAPHETAEKDQPKMLEADDLADKNLETVPTTSFNANSSSTATKSQIAIDKAPPPVAPTESAKHTSKEASAQSGAQITIAPAAKPPMKSLKRAAQKKVSFALAPTEIEDAESEKEQPVEVGPVHPVQASQGKGGLAEQPTLLDAKPESAKQPKPAKSLAEVDDVKEKQRILQVQTDEGLRREVKNVTVAMRQGNSRVRPERKKFTVRLTTGTEEKANLQFFKATGPSLKLYQSLDSSRDNLRVRKVTNRQYVMSVAKVAPPGDDTADIIVKYFLHFEEQDTFEEMYSQCVANLQKQQKPTARTKKADESSKISQTGIEEMKQDAKRLSPKKAGVKRSAEPVSAAQASKKSKLLADKKKLLDKMAALRRKKEQKGTSVVKERQTQSVAKASAGAPGYDASEKGNMRSDPSDPLKAKNVETKPKSMELDPGVTQETAPSPTESLQPPRKRTAENMSKENASKRARLPGLHSTNHAIGITRTPLLDGKSKPQTMSPKSMHGAAKDKLKEPAPDVGESPSMSGANHSKLHVQSSQKQSGEVSSEKGVPSTDTSKEQKLKEAEALKKLTRDLKQSQDEKNALQKELDSRSRLLDTEREKSLRVQRESSDAWQRIVKTVEALSADMRLLRREDTDRSLESLTRCEASSSEDFFDRLHSFRPSTWAAFENSDIGAMECALKGWYNCGPGKIRSSEGSEITLSESFDDPDFRHSEVERVRSLLREGHCLLSGWIGQSCPESFRTLEGSQRMLTKEQLRANVEGLREARLEESELRYEWAASALLLSDDICEKLAVYNWSMDGECLRCSWCNRRVVVEDESRFDAKCKHYAFCPFRAEDWKISVLRNAATLGIEGDGDVVMKD